MKLIDLGRVQALQEKRSLASNLKDHLRAGRLECTMLYTEAMGQYDVLKRIGGREWLAAALTARCDDIVNECLSEMRRLGVDTEATS